MSNLILNFDINGTITAMDSTDNDINHDCIANMVISKSIYGELDKFGKWVIGDDPYKIHNKSISYYNYCKKYFNSKYKSMVYTFTDNNKIGHKFRKHYDKIVDDIANDNIIFESFLKVLNKYNNAKLIFRTFGIDGPIIIDTLREKYKYNKPFTFAEYIRTKDEDILVLSNDIVIKGIIEIGKFITNHKRHLCIKDDYNFWSIQNNKNKECGKPMILNKDHIQIFFDDNNCVTTHHQYGLIVDDKYFNHINTIQAMTDDDYFLNIIKNYYP